MAKTIKESSSAMLNQHNDDIMGSSRSTSSVGGILQRTPPPLLTRDLPLLSPALLPNPQVMQTPPNPHCSIPKIFQIEVDQKRQGMPKMNFPRFDGLDARIWLDKCFEYFTMFEIPVSLRVLAASLHMVGPAAHWYLSYKHTVGFQSWDKFAHAVEKEFEVDTHRAKTMELINLR